MKINSITKATEIDKEERVFLFIDHILLNDKKSSHILSILPT